MSKSFWFVTYADKSETVAKKAKELHRHLEESDVEIQLICPICQHQASYTKPTPLNQYGLFRCVHCHSSTNEFFRALDVHRWEIRHVPRIQVSEVPIHELVEAAEYFISQVGTIFCCGKTLFHVDITNGMMSPLTEADIVKLLSKVAQWVRYDARSKSNRPIDPPSNVIKNLSQSSFHAGIQEIAGISRMPFIHDDGSLCLQAGYNRQEKVIGCFNPDDFLRYAWTKPLNKQDAIEALTELEQLFLDFPFQDEVDRSAAFESVLKAVHRALLPAAPMTFVQGNAPGCGKSTLCSILSKLATLTPVADTTLPSTAEEVAKTLISSLSASPGVIVFDNVAGRIPAFPALCICLTQPLFEQRRLGYSMTYQVSTRVLFLMNGNFVHPEADLLRRTLPLQLLAPNKHPEQREFNNKNILEYVTNNRARLIMCALRISAAYLQSSEKVSLPSLASYEKWTQRCREPLVWLGLKDPATRIFDQLDIEDDLTVNRFNLLCCLKQIFGDRPFSVRTILKNLTPELTETLIDLDLVDGQNVNRHALGRLLGYLSRFPEKNLKLEVSRRRAEYKVIDLGERSC